jgi:hypothetical protein
MAKKSQRELDHDLEARRIDRRAMVAESAVRYGCFLGIAWFLYLSVDTLAGRVTFADIGVRFVGQARVSESLAWFLAISGGAYGLRQRKLRRDTIQKQSARIKSLEERIDANRSSSHLSIRGTTRPEDEKI